jgi:hypothetical protein
MAPHRRAFSTAAPITLPPSGPNLVSRGDGQAGSLVTGKSGCLSAQNPGSQAVFAWGPLVASDSLAASHRRSATKTSAGDGIRCWPPGRREASRLSLAAIASRSPGAMRRGLRSRNFASLLNIAHLQFRFARQASERNAIGYVRPPTLTRQLPSRPISISCGSASPTNVIGQALP